MNQNLKAYAASLGGKARGLILKQQAIEARIQYNAVPKLCLHCRAPMLVSLDSHRSVFQTTKRRRFCSHSCAAAYSNARRERKQKPQKLHLERIKFARLNTITKGELFAQSKSWQAARSTIQRHAVYVYNTSNKPRACKVCSYSRHIEVCHLKAVNRFSVATLISEINHPDNLVALCRNHHWELDHGVLNLVSVGRIELPTSSL
jgi:hypothetical protein